MCWVTDSVLGLGTESGALIAVDAVTCGIVGMARKELGVPVYAITPSRDATIIAGSDDGVLLWDARTPTSPQSIARMPPLWAAENAVHAIDNAGNAGHASHRLTMGAHPPSSVLQCRT